MSNSDINTKLHKIVEYYSTFSYGKLFGIIDLNFNILHSDNFSPLIENMPDGVFVGKNLITDIPRTEARTKITLQNLNKCVDHRKTVKVLSIKMSRQDGYQILLISYTPIIESKSNTVIAIKIEADLPDIPLNIFRSRITLAENKNYPKHVLNQIKSKKLTKREHEVLYLLFQCNSREEIAKILSLSLGKNVTMDAVSKTINRNLYDKFNVYNIEDLKQKASDEEWHKRIPTSLYNEVIYPLEHL